MNLKEANKELEQLNNELNRLITDKKILFGNTQPKAVDTTKEIIKGGTRVDKLDNYVISLEEKQLDEKIDKIYARKNNFENWITTELKILKKYSELEQLIRYYKEDVTIEDKYTRREREMTWEEIGKEIHYSGEYCRKIYRFYKKKREV